MARIYQSDDWNDYRMTMNDPHKALEPLEKEIKTVGEALEVLREEGVLPHTNYDNEKLLAHRKAVAELFEIPWTAISHRMHTFISNAGAGVGPGAVYTAQNLIGVEIKPEEAERAERNVRKIDPTGVARIVAEDAIDTVANFDGEINILYLDADGDRGRGKGIYLEILQSAYDKMPKGSVVLAHNSVNSGERLEKYLSFVRDTKNMSASVNVIFDPEGLEVSVK
jgi:hypothetical protein